MRLMMAGIVGAGALGVLIGLAIVRALGWPVP